MTQYFIEIKAKHPSDPECQIFASNLLRAFSRWKNNDPIACSSGCKILFDEQGECGVKRIIAIADTDCSSWVKESGLHRKLAKCETRNTDKICASTALFLCWEAIARRQASVRFEKYSPMAIEAICEHDKSLYLKLSSEINSQAVVAWKQAIALYFASKPDEPDIYPMRRQTRLHGTNQPYSTVSIDGEQKAIALDDWAKFMDGVID